MTTGVLLLQLGTPDEASATAVRRFLHEFLSDPRVIESNRFVWWLILNGIILRTRPRKSAAKYRRLLDLLARHENWDESRQGMPLLYYSKRQVELLQQRLGNGYDVRLGMRYGNPNIRDALKQLVADGVDRVILVPMYPQYSATTTASALDGVFLTLMKERRVPSLAIVPPYYEHPAYLDAQEQVIRDHLAKLPEPPDHHILTYHGIPQRYVQAGDPYPVHIERTTRALVQRLGWAPGTWSLTYQSIFGREPWLQPYTEETTTQLARQGKKRVFIATPGFTADCLETVDEIGFEVNEAFLHAGGEALYRCPCLNDHPKWIECLETLVREQGGTPGRPETPPNATKLAGLSLSPPSLPA